MSRCLKLISAGYFGGDTWGKSGWWEGSKSFPSFSIAGEQLKNNVLLAL